jgi:hypothetical protein
MALKMLKFGVLEPLAEWMILKPGVCLWQWQELVEMRLQPLGHHSFQLGFVYCLALVGANSSSLQACHEGGLPWN